jgi:hypothetical protein
MTRWKKDETEFTVGISYSEKRGIQAYIPKPVIEFLGEPVTLTFIINGKSVKVEAGSNR